MTNTLMVGPSFCLNLPSRDVLSLASWQFCRLSAPTGALHVMMNYYWFGGLQVPLFLRPIGANFEGKTEGQEIIQESQWSEDLVFDDRILRQQFYEKPP